jgi:hypothetical protein
MGLAGRENRSDDLLDTPARRQPGFRRAQALAQVFEGL